MKLPKGVVGHQQYVRSYNTYGLKSQCRVLGADNASGSYTHLPVAAGVQHDDVVVPVEQAIQYIRAARGIYVRSTTSS